MAHCVSLLVSVNGSDSVISTHGCKCALFPQESSFFLSVFINYASTAQFKYWSAQI